MSEAKRIADALGRDNKYHFAEDSPGCDAAANALAAWFKSQEIERHEALIVMYRLIVRTVYEDYCEHPGGPNLKNIGLQLEKIRGWLAIEMAGFFRK